MKIVESLWEVVIAKMLVPSLPFVGVTLVIGLSLLLIDLHKGVICFFLGHKFIQQHIGYHGILSCTRSTYIDEYPD